MILHFWENLWIMKISLNGSLQVLVKTTSPRYTELYERLVNREAMILCTDTAAATPIVANATDARPRH